LKEGMNVLAMAKLQFLKSTMNFQHRKD